MSGVQLFWLVATFDLGMALFVMLAPSVKIAQRDAWLSDVLATLCSMLIMYAIMRVSLRHPDLTMVDYMPVILGKWIGLPLAVLMLSHWTAVTGIIVRQTTDVLITSVYHQTPVWMFVLTIIALAIYASHQGDVQAISRLTFLLGPVIAVALVGPMIANVPNIQFARLLPVYAASGPAKIIAGAVPTYGFLGQAILVGMFTPMVQHPSRMTRYAVAGVAVSGAVLIMGAVMVVGLFGAELPTRMWNPFLDAIRYISIAGVFEKFDAIIVLAWFMSAFIRISAFLYVSAYGWARLFHMRNWRVLLWGLGVIDAMVALWPHNIVSTFVTWIQTVHEPIAIPVLLTATPLLLWVVSALRGRLGKGRGQAKQKARRL